MTTAFQDPIAFRPPHFGSAWAATSSFEMFSATPNRRDADKYFGGVGPIWNDNRGFSLWTHKMPTYWPVLDSSDLKERRHLDFLSAHALSSIGSPPVVGGKSVFHAASDRETSTRRGIAICVSGLQETQQPMSNFQIPWERPGAGVEAFAILERARQLLNEQRISEARNVLRFGSSSYPDDDGIAELMRAISPGRTQTLQGTTSNRSQEMNWIQQNGHQFRGLWIAVSGDLLVSSASTLESLLADLKGFKDNRDMPVVQKIALK